MAEFYDWSTLAATNNFAPPNGAPENMDYRDVNDTIRELMAQQARWRESVRGGTTTGGSQPAYTFTAPQTLGAYAVGQIFTFIAHADSTGAVTLNVSAPGALGARNVIDSRGAQLGSGDIKQNGVYTVITTASTFRVIGHLSQASLRTLIQDTLNRAYTTTNVADAYSITTDNPITAYVTGQLFAFTANFTNTTTSPTLNVDAVGAGALQDTSGSALGVGTIINGQTYLTVRTASAFRVIAGLGFNGILPVVNGGTGSSTAAGARTNLGAVNIAGDTFTGNVSITGGGGSVLTMNGPGNNGIELGRVDGSASSSLIDFHSGATAVDYDVRVIATGGSGVAGGGTLDVIAASLTTNGVLTAGIRSTQQFTGNGTWTKPAGCKRILVFGTGGGGGGGETNTTNHGGGGGGAGGTCIKFIDVTGITSETVTIGGGGAGGTAAGTGATGGNTTFGAHFTASGGVGGVGTGAGLEEGGLGGTAATGDINIPGGDGGPGGAAAGMVSGGGGASFWGGGGRGTATSQSGTDARAYGAGGGGGFSGGSTVGGVGKAGIVWVIEFGA